MLPYINDTEENLKGILDYCFETEVKGIICFGIGTTMRGGSREYFYQSLDRHFPGMKQKYIQRFGSSYECNSDNNATLMRVFHACCHKQGIMHNTEEIFAYLHELPENYAVPFPVL